jgi:hypothetical protein
LYKAGADVVLSGHDHDYERFAPQTSNGGLDIDHGIREFVVGTGGKNLRGFFRASPKNSEVRQDVTFGVLRLELYESGYRWQYVPEHSDLFSDSGSATCHSQNKTPAAS